MSVNNQRRETICIYRNINKYYLAEEKEEERRIEKEEEEGPLLVSSVTSRESEAYLSKVAVSLDWSVSARYVQVCRRSTATQLHKHTQNHCEEKELGVSRRHVRYTPGGSSSSSRKMFNGHRNSLCFGRKSMGHQSKRGQNNGAISADKSVNMMKRREFQFKICTTKKEEERAEGRRFGHPKKETTTTGREYWRAFEWSALETGKEREKSLCVPVWSRPATEQPPGPAGSQHSIPWQLNTTASLPSRGLLFSSLSPLFFLLLCLLPLNLPITSWELRRRSYPFSSLNLMISRIQRRRENEFVVIFFILDNIKTQKDHGDNQMFLFLTATV